MENIQALRRRGLALYRAGDYATAINIYVRIKNVYPRDAWSHHHLAFVLGLSGLYSSAIKEYKEAISLSDRSDYCSGWYRNMGNLYHEKGRYEQAELCYHRALWLNPDSWSVRMNLADLLETWGRGEEALSLYEEVVHLTIYEHEEIADEVRKGLERLSYRLPENR